MDEKHITLLGFDFGLRSIGVAVGQTITKTAKPMGAIRAQNGVPSWDQIAELVRRWQPNALVVGIPLNMDGTEQPMTDFARKFASELEVRFNLPVHAVDERLTTIEARAQIFEGEGYRALKKSAVDAESAKIILENWMNRR